MLKKNITEEQIIVPLAGGHPGQAFRLGHTVPPLNRHHHSRRLQTSDSQGVRTAGPQGDPE